MKSWLKQQLTELSAWAGFIMIVGAYIFPNIAFVIIGVLLIASDDQKAKEFFQKIGAWFSKQIDHV
jgi:uncharacterized membrane protein YdbT with pleckstrin-like domain